MLAGIALSYSQLSQELVERHGLRRRVHDRGGDLELQFLLRDRERVLPVRLEGQLQVVSWGKRNKAEQPTPVALTYSVTHSS